jgi:hypothetical protein
VPVVVQENTGKVNTAVMPWASTMGITESARPVIDVVPLMETTGFAYIDRNYGDVRPNSFVFDNVAGLTQVESLLGVAVSGRGASTSGEGSFKLVVFGTSRWLEDGITERSDQNLALGLNLIDWLAQDDTPSLTNWLAQKDTLAAVRSKSVTTRDLLFTSSTHENISRWANIAGVPLGLVAIGLLRSVRRRRFGLSQYGGQSEKKRSRFSIKRRRKSSQGDGSGDSE